MPDSRNPYDDCVIAPSFDLIPDLLGTALAMVDASEPTSKAALALSLMNGANDPFGEVERASRRGSVLLTACALAALAIDVASETSGRDPATVLTDVCGRLQALPAGDATWIESLRPPE